MTEAWLAFAVLIIVLLLVGICWFFETELRLNVKRFVVWCIQPGIGLWRQIESVFRPNGLRSQQGALLWVLTVTAERQLPIGTAMQAFANDNRGSYAFQIRRLAEWLDSGVALPDALSLSAPGILSKEALLSIRVGHENGTLAESLRLAARKYSTPEFSQPSASRLLFYVCAVLLVMTQIIGFIMYWIIPKFRRIFQDFDTELPGLTILLINVSNTVVNYWLLLPLGAVMLWFGAAIWISIVDRFKLFNGWLDFENLWLRRQVPQILRELSVVVESGRPVVSGLAAIVEYHPVVVWRKRLSRIQEQIEQGADIWNSMESARLIRRKHVMLLEAAQRAQNLPWALRQIANNIERVLHVRSMAIGQFLEPLLILVLGVVVGTIVVALFLPLVSLINELAL